MGRQPGHSTPNLAGACDIPTLAGLHKEFTPRGQGQGRDFCWDFAQPSLAVRGDTAAPDATRGSPSRTLQQLAGRFSPGKILPDRSKITSYGNLGRRARISVLNVGNAIGQFCGWENFRGIRPPKLHSRNVLNFGNRCRSALSEANDVKTQDVLLR